MLEEVSNCNSDPVPLQLLAPKVLVAIVIGTERSRGPARRGECGARDVLQSHCMHLCKVIDRRFHFVTQLREGAVDLDPCLC